jgi:hypothetical protein
MKLLLACVVFFTASAWSVVGLWNTSLQFEKNYLNIDTVKTPNVDTLYLRVWLDYGLAYYSTLDTNCAVFSKPRIPKINIYCWVPHDSLYYVMAQVLRYEFMNWQKWGILVMSKDSAQKMIDFIVPESSDIVNTDIFFRKECEANPLKCYYATGAAGGGSGIPAEDAGRLPQKKVLLNAESENPGTTSLKRDSRMSSQSVGKIPLGMGYKAFDLNGIYLYRGTWQGEFKSPSGAVILKFDNGRSAKF